MIRHRHQGKYRTRTGIVKHRPMHRHRKASKSIVRYNPIKHQQQLERLYDQGEFKSVLPNMEQTASAILEGETTDRTKLIQEGGKIVGFLNIENPRKVYPKDKFPDVEEQYPEGTYGIGLELIKSERRKGKGTQIIENIFKDPKVNSLDGGASDVAEGFWKKLGAKFDYPSVEEGDTGDYIHFTLKRKDFLESIKKNKNNGE